MYAVPLSVLKTASSHPVPALSELKQAVFVFVGHWLDVNTANDSKY
jgi:hypothetical protein